MDELLQILALLGLLGAGTIGGVFFAFSSFVMRSLVALPPEMGLAAMQTINVRVLNPHFLGCFMGTALISVGCVIVGVLRLETAGSSFILCGGALYLLGTFVITGVCNVPLNNSLALVSQADPSSGDKWLSYARRWTLWNHLRTVSALLATLLFGLGLMQA